MASLRISSQLVAPQHHASLRNAAQRGSAQLNATQRLAQAKEIDAGDVISPAATYKSRQLVADGSLAKGHGYKRPLATNG